MNKKTYMKPIAEVGQLQGKVTMEATSWTVTGNGEVVNDDEIIKIIDGDPEGGRPEDGECDERTCAPEGRRGRRDLIL